LNTQHSLLFFQHFLILATNFVDRNATRFKAGMPKVNNLSAENLMVQSAVGWGFNGPEISCCRRTCYKKSRY
jgi:hypothetical protein